MMAKRMAGIDKNTSTIRIGTTSTAPPPIGASAKSAI
jgi:hypothetical protein